MRWLRPELHSSHREEALWYAGLATAVVAILGYFALPTEAAQACWYLGVGALSAGCIVVGVVRHRPPNPAAWLLLAASIACAVVADAIYFVREQILQEAVLFPGPADAVYLLSYPMAALGLWLFVRRANGSNRAPLLDSTIVTVTGGLILWQFIIGQYFGDPTVGLLAQVISATYLLGDLLVLAFALRLVMTDWHRGPSLWLLIVGTSGLLCADVAYALLGLTDSYRTGNWIDVGWLGQYLLYAGAALHPAMAQLSTPPTKIETPNRRRLLMLIPFGLVAPLIGVLGSRERALDTIAVAVAGASLFLLVVARMWDLVSTLTSSLAERSRLSEALRVQAEADPLTGLLNRRLFTARVQAALAEGDVLVAFCDLDEFKAVNDGHGHATGDELLMAVADRMRSGLREPQDAVARLGGDEFGVLIAGDPLPASAGKRLTAMFDKPFELSSGSVRVTASIGLAKAQMGTDYAALLADADVAMYMAKRQGRAQFAVFDPPQRELVLGYPNTIAALREALVQQQLVVHYQPIVTVYEGELAGLEALVRWQRPGHGLLLPTDFLSAAEASGLMPEIDRFVLTRALSDLRRWRGLAPRLRVSVNLAAGSIGTGALSASVAAALSAEGLPADALTLEITERVLIEDANAAQTELKALSDSGVSIALDDFGTGHSGLLQLKQFPVDILKLDRRFVSSAGADAEASALLRAAVRLGQTLGLQVLAEGVETHTQWAGLREFGCDFAQGYLFAPALAAEDVDALLERAGTTTYLPRDGWQSPIRAA